MKHASRIPPAVLLLSNKPSLPKYLDTIQRLPFVVELINFKEFSSGFPLWERWSVTTVVLRTRFHKQMFLNLEVIFKLFLRKRNRKFWRKRCVKMFEKSPGPFKCSNDLKLSNKLYGGNKFF